MKIAYVYDGVWPYTLGGLEKRVWDVATGLAARGHEVHWFGIKYWGGPSVLVQDSVYLHGVCSPQPLFVKGRRSIREPIIFAIRLLPHLLKQRYDIVECEGFPYFPCFSAKLHSLLWRSRLVVLWHEVWGDYWFDYLGKWGVFGKVVEKLVAHVTNDMVAVSECTRRDLRQVRASSAIELIPNGVHISQIEQVSPSGQSYDIVYAGRLVEHKHIDLLIRAIKHLKYRGQNVNCAIIGGGPEEKRLKDLVEEAELQGDVHFLGSLPDHQDVLSYIKSSRVFVLPSTREGFGIAAVEANACGLPVITVRHPQNGASYLIDERRNGFLCELSESDIADKISAALSSNNWQQSCKQSAMKYDINRIVDMTEAFYERVLKRQ